MLIAIVLAVVAFGGAAASAQDLEREVLYFQREDVLGTSLKVGIDSVGISAAAAADEAVRAEIARSSAVVSTWDPESELSRALRATGPVKVSDELFALLAVAEKWRTATGGAFHPATGGLTALWRAAADAGRDPKAEDVAAEAARLVAPPYVLDAAARTVVFASGARIALDGVAKGFVIDRAAAVAAANGPQASVALVAIGGDMVIRGKKPLLIDVRDPRFPADNEDPLCRIKFAGRALATSGGYARGFAVAGKKHSHVFDPRTGRPAAHVLGASVLAPDAATADALATALQVLPVEEGMKLIAATSGADAVIVAANGDVRVTEGFRKLAEPGAFFGPRKAPPTWPAGYAVAVEFELQDPTKAGADGARRRGGYKRPYVAVWAEDAQGRPVRTLCLWVENLRWLDDLKRWRKLYRERGEAFVSASSSATRKAGVYTLAWDGRTDDGKPVPAGEYVLCIEVAREHGTYQIARETVKLGDATLKREIAGNVEMKRAEIRYGKAP